MRSKFLAILAVFCFGACAFAQPPRAAGHERLKIFEPLIDAEWRSTADTEQGRAVESYSFEWTSYGAFILFTHNLTIGEHSHTERGVIGWDPEAGKLRFWGFLADGSFFDGHAVEPEEDAFVTFDVKFTGSRLQRARISLGAPNKNVLIYGVAMMHDQNWSQKYERAYQRVISTTQRVAMVNGYRITTRAVEPRRILSVRAACAPEEISRTLGRLYAEINGSMARVGAESAGQPLAIYHDFGDVVELEAAIPVDRDVESGERVKFGRTPGGEVAVLQFSGPYHNLPRGHAAMDIFLEGNNLEPAGPPWEVYITDPATEPDESKWRTDIYYPVK